MIVFLTLDIRYVLPFHLDRCRNRNPLQLELVFHYLDSLNIRLRFLTHHFPQYILNVGIIHGLDKIKHSNIKFVFKELFESCFEIHTYSKWYFLSFSWLTCTIWFEVMTFKASADGRDFCCLGFRFNGLNLFEDFLWWKEGLNDWEELIDFNASEFVLFLPFLVRLPLIDFVCFFSMLFSLSTESLAWSAFLLVLRSLKKVIES